MRYSQPASKRGFTAFVSPRVHPVATLLAPRACFTASLNCAGPAFEMTVLIRNSHEKHD